MGSIPAGDVSVFLRVVMRVNPVRFPLGQATGLVSGRREASHIVRKALLRPACGRLGIIDAQPSVGLQAAGYEKLTFPCNTPDVLAGVPRVQQYGRDGVRSWLKLRISSLIRWILLGKVISARSHTASC